MIKNLTPHPVHVVDGEGKIIKTIPTSEEVLRLPEITSPAGEVDGVPAVQKSLNPTAELPPAAEGVYYIVSLPVAQATRRGDFLVPDDLVRDENGRVVGCRRFAVVA